MQIITKIMCKLGFHYWGYQSKATGIYLHTLYNGTLPRSEDYYTGRRKCFDCGKTEYKGKECK